MEGRQAVHEKRASRLSVVRIFHDAAVHLIRAEKFNALFPYAVRLTHGNPYVRTDHIRIPGALHGILRQRDGSARLRGDLPALLHQLLRREIGLGRAGSEVHAHLGTGYHVGISHIISGVAHVHQLHALQPSQMLPDGQKVRQHLSGMKFVGQSVPYRNARISGKLFHNVLTEAPVLDSLIHPSQNPRRIRNALLLTDLGARRIQIGGSKSQIMGRHFKGAAGSRARFFKNQSDVLSAKNIHRNPLFLFFLQIRREVKQVFDFLRRIIQQL